MKMKYNTPDEYIGEVIGDLNRRAARLSPCAGSAGRAEGERLRAALEMFGYATQLRSLSSGRPINSMEFSRTYPLGKEVQEKVLKASTIRSSESVGPPGLA